MRTRGYIPILNFQHRHGRTAIADLVELLNEGRTHQEIATLWHCDRANLTRFIRTYLQRIYILQPDARLFLNDIEEAHHAAHRRRNIEERTIIQLADQRPPGDSSNATSPDRPA